MKKRLIGIILFGILGLVVLCIAMLGITALSNRGLADPVASYRPSFRTRKGTPR